MPDQTQRPSRRALWVGLLLAAAAVLSNAGFFIGLPGQGAIVWVSVALAALALILVVRGLMQAFRPPAGGKVLSSVLATVTLLLAAFALFSFFVARAIPASTSAPTVGQKVPDFTLPDTGGKPVSLAQLLASSAPSGPNKAVLLVFYRGYW